ncbi:MAG: hypothetical protein JO258_07960 [Alphaproteobacteria bacterium]|nr:hypothetical protein [Alphaproteobacteria bacterium]
MIDRKFVSIAALSTLAAAFFFYAGGFMVPGGAMNFFFWADSISTGATLSPEISQRDVGFPLLIWLSGYRLTGSLTGIALIYALFAALMPMLIYWSLRPFAAWAALLTALASILSCGPYFFQKMLYHDQACMFFMMLTLCWYVLFVARQKYFWFYLFTAAAFFDSVTRPAMNLIFPALLLLAIVFGPRPLRWRHYVISLAAVAIVIAGYHAHRNKVFDVASLGYMPSYTGEQVFYATYINSADYSVDLSKRAGPALSEVRAKLWHALTEPTPEEAEQVKGFVASEPKEFADAELKPFAPEVLFERIWHQPNYEYLLLIETVVDDHTLLRSAVEIILHHPWYFATYTLRGAWHYLFDPGWAHTRFNTAGYVHVRLDFYPLLVDPTEAQALPARAQAEVLEPPAYPLLMEKIANGWLGFFNPLIKVTSVLMVLGWAILAIGARRFSRSFIGCFAGASVLLLYNALIVGAFAEADYRYEMMVMVLRVAVAGFGLATLLEALRQLDRIVCRWLERRRRSVRLEEDERAALALVARERLRQSPVNQAEPLRRAYAKLDPSGQLAN